VEHFRCIRKAKIELAPGLNILYGPNDLGKSSLAHAIRAALLLQSSAREHVEFVSWQATGDPYVELVFESEPQRIWRVKKTFGTASAFLEWSKDGVDFAMEARGREVDGKLSEILRWGVAPPGGKGRPKGMPMSFLSTALLPEQDRVSAIFEQQLAEDSDESGKMQLVAALQAIAEDPLFKAVLARVQERVDEAFNSSGGRKRGKNSPWVKLSEELQQKTERHQGCLDDLQKTTAIELELQQLHEQQLAAKEAAAKAQESIGKLQDDFEKQSRRQEIQERLQERERQLAEIARQLREVTEAEKTLAEEGSKIDGLARVRDEAKLAANAAAQQEQKAKEELARLEGGDRARDRQLQQSSLDARRAELRTEQIRLQASLEAIRRVEAADAKVRSIDREVHALTETASTLQKIHEKTTAARQELAEQQLELSAVRAGFRWQTASDGFQQAEKALEQTAAWKSEAADWRTKAAALESAQPSFELASRDDIENFRRLESDLRVARAKLEVGLSVTLRPKRPIRISVQRDGAAATRQDLSRSAFEVTARREISIEIEDIAEITLAGGAQDARQEVERLDRRWSMEAEPALAEAGVNSLDELALVVSDAAQRTANRHAAVREAAQLEQRIADQPDWASLLPQRQQDLAAADAALGGEDRAKLAQRAAKLRIHDADDADKKIASLGLDHDRRVQEERQQESDLAVANARCGEKRLALEEARRELETLQAPFGKDWQVALQEVQSQQKVGQTELDRIDIEIAGLAKSGNEGVEEARKALARSTEALAKLEAKRQEADQKLSEAILARAAHEGELKVRLEAVAQLDEQGAKAVAEAVRTELQAAPAPLQAVSEEVLAEARKRLADAVSQAETVDGKIREKRGALQQVGGDVAKQRAEDAATELEEVRVRERQMELEFNAWELLRQTLRDAEQEEGTHLGRALAEPIAKRFADLTAGRYGQLALGPNLETQGIAVAGQDRPVGLLSVGTRDQLSTIFRLTLAEELKTAVILDDQLTQTDSGRMSWLRDLLKEISANIQVIVFTCRPDDYVFPAKGRRKEVLGQQQSRALDLTPLITRFTSAEA
jgi:hypothetical protein